MFLHQKRAFVQPPQMLLFLILLANAVKGKSYFDAVGLKMAPCKLYNFGFPWELMFLLMQEAWRTVT